MLTYHLLNAVETLAVEAERLLKQHLVLYCPLVRKGCEVGQVSQRLLHIMLVPEQHAQRLKNKEVIKICASNFRFAYSAPAFFPYCDHQHV